MNGEVAGSILTVFPVKRKKRDFLMFIQKPIKLDHLRTTVRAIRSLQVMPIPKKFEVKNWILGIYLIGVPDCSELSFVARMTNRHGHTDWVCLTGACLMSMGGENTAVNYGGEKGRHLRPQLVQKLESKSVCTWYLAFAMHICVCLEACDYSELSFVARMTNRHGHTDWVCLTLVLA